MRMHTGQSRNPLPGCGPRSTQPDHRGNYAFRPTPATYVGCRIISEEGRDISTGVLEQI